MKNKKRRTIVYGAMVIAAGTFCTALSLKNSLNMVSADNDPLLSISFVMREGASVRYYLGATDEETKKECGLRFAATLDKDTYLALEALEGVEGDVDNTEIVSVSYGMLIAPYSAVKENDLTADTVFGYSSEDAKIYTWEGEDADGKLPILNITYDDLLLADGSEDTYEIKGSIVALNDYNYVTEFVGRAYIKYVHGDTIEYKFAEYAGGDVANNTRSATYVSQKAIESTAETEETKAWVKKVYIDGLPADYQETTYTVNTYVNGDLESTSILSAAIAAQTAAATEYSGFTLDENKSSTAQVVYANGKTVANYYYIADDANEENTTQIANGGFETGTLENTWTMQGDIGGVSSETNYFKGDELSADGFSFGLDGTYMFSAFAVSTGDEKVGWLKSSTFTISQNGWLTFKIGGGGDNRLLYIDVINSETGIVLKRFANQKFTSETIDNVKLGCKLNAYKANLQDLAGQKVYLRITDGDSGNSTKAYGTIFLDSFNAMHIGEPSNSFTLATDLLTDTTYNAYSLYNGDFSDGIAGWINSGEIGVVQSTTTSWAGAYGNNGNFFSAYKTTGDGDSLEGNTGYLQSSPFVLGGTGMITFRIGGMKNSSQVYLEVIDWDSNEVYSRYYNEYFNDATNGTALLSYRADLSQYLGKTICLRFVDNATSDWGLLFTDDIATYYQTTPTAGEYHFAKNMVYNTFENGSFERGLTGWTLTNGDGSAVTNATTYWADNSNFWWKEKEDGETNDDVTTQRYEKDGDYFYMSGDGTTGTLTSSTFAVAGDGVLTFKLGGNSENIRVEICLADTNAVISTIKNDQFNDPLCAETMLRRFVNLKNYIGQNIYVRIVDEKEGGIGMAMFDSMMFVSANEAASIIAEDKEIYTAYYGKVNASSTATDTAKNIVKTLYDYYQSLAVPAAIA